MCTICLRHERYFFYREFHEIKWLFWKKEFCENNFFLQEIKVKLIFIFPLCAQCVHDTRDIFLERIPWNQKTLGLCLFLHAKVVCCKKWTLKKWHMQTKTICVMTIARHLIQCISSLVNFIFFFVIFCSLVQVPFFKGQKISKANYFVLSFSRKRTKIFWSSS